MLCFGMPTLIENGSLDENLSLCAGLGLKFLELNMNFPEYGLACLAEPERLRAAAGTYGIFYTVHLDERLDIADFNPLVRQAYLETALRTIDAAKALETPVINMHMNHGIFITLPDRKVWMYSREKENYLDAFRRFRDECTRRIGGSGVTVSIENTDGFTEFEKEAIALLLESPVFGLTWDIGHSKATAEKDVPFLMSLSDRLHHMHIHDGTEQPPRNHLALGDGAIDLSERLDFAEKNGCRCVLETKTTAALRASAAWLREHGRL